MRRTGKRGQKLYKGYPKIHQYIIKRSGSKCEVMEFVLISFVGGRWKRCGRHGAMVDHITPRNMAGSNSEWLNDERNLMCLCLDHGEIGRYRTYREEKYRSLQMLYPNLEWDFGGPWTEFLTEQRR